MKMFRLRNGWSPVELDDQELISFGPCIKKQVVFKC